MLGIFVTQDDLDDAIMELDPENLEHIAKNDFVAWWVQLHDDNKAKEEGKDRDLDEETKARLLDVRRDRKMLERDAELLRNRIELLKKEENKTLRRVAAANKQAASMYVRKKNSEMKAIGRRKLRRDRLKEVKTSQEQNYVRKELARIAKMRAATDIVNRKMKAAQDIKVIRRDLEAQKRQLEREALHRAKQHHKLVVARRQKHKIVKQERLKERGKKSELTYLKGVVAERKLQRAKHEQLKLLEDNEARMIQRVQNVHLMQTEALGSLGDVLCD